MSRPTPAYRAARARQIAARAQYAAPIGPPATDLRARTTPVNGRLPIRKSRGTRLTKTQRNSQGRYSEWNRSPFEPVGGWR